MIPADLTVPAAARMQGETTRRDYVATDLARLAHPSVRWWWGQRVVAGTNGAVCYLCGRMPAKWVRRWPITVQAQADILAHLDRHAAMGHLQSGTNAAGTLPADGASTGGSQP